jgi:hypothetical protein
VKRADGKTPVFRNYSQQRKFRESQEFMRLRFNVKSTGQDSLIDYGSDLEAAAFELAIDDRLGTPGELAHEMKEDSRYGQLLAAQGFPDWYFWRFWYSETNTN